MVWSALVPGTIQSHELSNDFATSNSRVFLHVFAAASLFFPSKTAGDFCNRTHGAGPRVIRRAAVGLGAADPLGGRQSYSTPTAEGCDSSKSVPSSKEFINSNLYI